MEGRTYALHQCSNDALGVGHNIQELHPCDDGAQPENRTHHTQEVVRSFYSQGESIMSELVQESRSQHRCTIIMTTHFSRT